MSNNQNYSITSGVYWLLLKETITVNRVSHMKLNIIHFFGFLYQIRPAHFNLKLLLFTMHRVSIVWAALCSSSSCLTSQDFPTVYQLFSQHIFGLSAQVPPFTIYWSKKFQRVGRSSSVCSLLVCPDLCCLELLIFSRESQHPSSLWRWLAFNVFYHWGYTAPLLNGFEDQGFKRRAI